MLDVLVDLKTEWTAFGFTVRIPEGLAASYKFSHEIILLAMIVPLVSKPWTIIFFFYFRTKKNEINNYKCNTSCGSEKSGCLELIKEIIRAATESVPIVDTTTKGWLATNLKYQFILN